MKSEPSSYSIDALKQDGRAVWDVVQNYLVRNPLHDDMQVGDWAVLYHSNTEAETGLVGIMEIHRICIMSLAEVDRHK